MTTVPRFKHRGEGGLTACYWEGTLVAHVRLSMFPERKEMDGYSVTFKNALFSASKQHVEIIISNFMDASEAVEFVRKACVIAFADIPSIVDEDVERPIIRPRDDHVHLN